MNLKLKTYRVCGEEKGSYYVMDPNENIFRAELKGSFYYEDLVWPSIGDWIEGEFQPGDWVVIHETVHRKNALQRKDPNGHSPQVFASNVDYMFVVTSANLDLNEKRLDRFVAMALSCDVSPVIIVNKIELAENSEIIIASLQERFQGFPVHGVSVYDNRNKEVFSTYLRDDTTAVFVGTSGVGKSSLVNWLIGKPVQATSEIREDDSRGRHTTTQRSLHRLPHGGILIDTPGIRVLGLVDADEAIEGVFQDIVELTSMCRFSDCAHESEPGCAVQTALEDGTLDEDRWSSFLKLKREESYLQKKSDPVARMKDKARYKQMGKLLKDIKKERARR